jgi:hypothetical protein
MIFVDTNSEGIMQCNSRNLGVFTNAPYQYARTLLLSRNFRYSYSPPFLLILLEQVPDYLCSRRMSNDPNLVRNI